MLAKHALSQLSYGPRSARGPNVSRDRRDPQTTAQRRQAIAAGQNPNGPIDRVLDKPPEKSPMPEDTGLDPEELLERR